MYPGSAAPPPFAGEEKRGPIQSKIKDPQLMGGLSVLLRKVCRGFFFCCCCWLIQRRISSFFFFLVIVCLLGSASFFDSPTLPLKWTNLEAENLSAALAELCRSTEYFLHKPILCWRLFQPVLSTFPKPFFKK